MRRVHLAFASVLVAAAAAMLARAANGPVGALAPNGGGDHVLRIAVINVHRIYAGIKEGKQAAQADLNERMALDQEGRRREQDITEFKNKRDGLKPGSQQWQDMGNALHQKIVDIKNWQQSSQLDLEQHENQRIKDIYDRIASATAAIAQRDGLDLVIADQGAEIGPDLWSVSHQQLEQVLTQRTIMYANKRADITEDVLTKVEADYAAHAPAASAGGK